MYCNTVPGKISELVVLVVTNSINASKCYRVYSVTEIIIIVKTSTKNYDEIINSENNFCYFKHVSIHAEATVIKPYYKLRIQNVCDSQKERSMIGEW